MRSEEGAVWHVYYSYQNEHHNHSYQTPGGWGGGEGEEEGVSEGGME